MKVSDSRGRVVLHTLGAFISLAGLALATYLTVLHLTGETAACGGSPDCHKVLGSNYAKLGQIPVAAFGAAGHFGAFSCATFAAFGYAGARRFFSWNVWLMFLGTLYLLAIQTFVLHAFCRLCLFSAAVTFLLAGLVAATPPGRPPKIP